MRRAQFVPPNPAAVTETEIKVEKQRERANRCMQLCCRLCDAYRHEVGAGGRMKGDDALRAFSDFIHEADAILRS